MNAIQDVLAALLDPEERIEGHLKVGSTLWGRRIRDRITDLPITAEAVLRALGKIEP